VGDIVIAGAVSYRVGDGASYLLIIRRHRSVIAICRLLRQMLPQRGLSVCMSATLVHPAKAVGRNDMSFGRDFRVLPTPK